MIRACVLTFSDRGSKGERDDKSGPEAMDMLRALGAEISHYEIMPDEMDLISSALLKHSGTVDLIITTGGTGLTPRDVAPEATLRVLERRIPGIPEAMRAAGMSKTPRAMLSRAEAGVCKGTLIINLPGSQKAVREGLEAITDVLVHAIEKIKGDPTDCGRDHEHVHHHHHHKGTK